MFLLNGYDPWDHDGSYFYDEQAAERPITFCRKYLTHAKGEFAGKPLILHPDHANYFRCLFGWRRKDTGFRRYRYTMYTAARGNAKTTISSLLGHWMTYADGEGGAEVYICASTRDQASLNFDVIKQQVYNKTALRSRLTVLESRKRIIYPKNNSYLVAVASEAGGSHGWNTHCCICDELKNWEGQQGRDFFGAIETSLGKRRQPLLYMSSTQAYSREGIWWDLFSYAKAVKEKPSVAYEWLPLIYEMDANDDPFNLENIKKANPLWGTGVNPDHIARMMKKAQEVSSFENEFIREHGNRITEQQNRFIKMADFYACPTHEPSGLEKEHCVAALDTSSTRDLTALALYWPSLKTVRVWFWIPGQTARSKSIADGFDYSTELNRPDQKNNLEFTPNKRIDREKILEKVKALRKQYKILACAYDPWEGKVGLVADMQKTGLRMVEYGQSYHHMNAPCKEFEKLIAEHELNVGQSKLFAWNVQNMCIAENPTGMIRPVKPDEENKRIDGAVAAIMCLGIAKSISAVTVSA